MLHHELRIEVDPRCVSVWKEPWARRSARVTLLVDLDDKFVIVVDTSNGFWFLPGGGVEKNELIEETAKREAAEELGLEIKINRVIGKYHVTLISRQTKEQLKIHPFVVMHATCTGGQIRTEYDFKRKIVLIRKGDCGKLLQDFEIPEEYECMKPYLCISKQTVKDFLRRQLTCI